MKIKNHIGNFHKIPYHLWVVYKPGYGAAHGANYKDVQNYACYVKKGQADVDGLIRRIVNNQLGQYKKIRLYNDQTSQVERAWDENGFEVTPEVIAKINLNAQRKNTFNDKTQTHSKRI